MNGVRMSSRPGDAPPPARIRSSFTSPAEYSGHLKRRLHLEPLERLNRQFHLEPFRLLALFLKPPLPEHDVFAAHRDPRHRIYLWSARNTLLTLNPADLQTLVTLKMPFGKYKGRLLADLPGPYLAWFARKGFPPGQIGRLLELMYEIDHNDLRSLLVPLKKTERRQTGS